MEDVRNSDGRLVCRISVEQRVVEIVLKGQRTIICFKSEGSLEVINTKAR